MNASFGVQSDERRRTGRSGLIARIGRGLTLSVALWAGSALAPSLAHASPRDDVLMAYIDAAQQLNDLELEKALETLDAAVAGAQAAGLGNDASLAKPHAMRAGLIFSLSGDRGQTVAALEQAVQADYHVTLPIELASAELQAMLDEARGSVTRPTEPMIHQPPTPAPGQDIEFAALANMQVPDDASMVLYWRPKGSGSEFKADYMTMFGNFGSVAVPAAEHEGKDLEYFFYLFDGQNSALLNLGNKQAPLVLEAPLVAAGDADGGDGEPAGDGDDDEGKDDKGDKKPRGKSKMPRVFINLGVGLGAGIARGTAEQTYEQYTPGNPDTLYGLREQACAVERWFEAGAPVAGDPIAFQQNLNTIQMAGANILPAPAQDLVMAYDPAFCARRHPVSTGMALAPFHIAPEVGVRVANNMVLSVFTRLQVVTGSQVYTEDPNKQLSQSFQTDVRSPAPAGFRSKPPFTWAVGVKFKYFFLPEENKFRLFAGGFAGYGSARLRVPMGFSNDRNGNSVPDAAEAAIDGIVNPVDQTIDPATCVVVWPYNQGCDGGANTQGEQLLAESVRAATSATDERIDTVVIGPGFVGALFGFNYQIHKNFAFFGEVNVGGWFPNISSALFDLTVGPAITF